jgi:FixJ family two-component response regulator
VSLSWSRNQKPEIGVPKKPLIAVVDDDEAVRTALQGLVKSLGFAAAAFASAVDFLRSRQLQRTDCIIADVNMPAITGPELHRRLLAASTPIPIILITAYPNDHVRDEALRAGVVGYLTKPFSDDDLLAYLRLALKKSP